jgi:hypothetical protein
MEANVESFFLKLEAVFSDPDLWPHCKFWTIIFQDPDPSLEPRLVKTFRVKIWIIP